MTIESQPEVLVSTKVGVLVEAVYKLLCQVKESHAVWSSMPELE